MKNIDKFNYCLGIGGANIDIIINSINDIKIHDSNPSKFKITPGGVMRNILENISKLNEKAILLTSIGNDDFGKIILEKSIQSGINMDYVYINNDKPSSSYLAFLDHLNNDLFVGASDMTILDDIPISYFEENQCLFDNAKIIIIDSNLNEKTIKEIIKRCKNVPIYVDPVSSIKAVKLIPFLKDIHTIKPNLLELEVLSNIKINNDEDIIEACNILLQQGVKEIITSLGDRGIYYKSKEKSFFKSFKKCEMKNATGAGDAFFAGFIKGRMNDLDLDSCIDQALACGIIAVKSDNTISDKMSIEEIEKIIKEYKI